MVFLYSSSLNEAKGAAPLLCQVSKTNSSRCIFALHFLHLIETRSIHGLCNSKSGPSGRSSATSIISFLENSLSMFSHSVHFQIGIGQPQNLSLEMHHGCFSLIISKNLFLVGQKNIPLFVRHQLLYHQVYQACKNILFAQAKLACVESASIVGICA